MNGRKQSFCGSFAVSPKSLHGGFVVFGSKVWRDGSFAGFLDAVLFGGLQKSLARL